VTRDDFRRPFLVTKKLKTLKNKLFLFETLIAIFFSLQASCQTIISTDSLSRNIKGNIVMVGVIHSATLYEKAKDGSIVKASLTSDTSEALLCSVLPEIMNNSKGKPIVILMEGLRPTESLNIDSASIARYRLPRCLSGAIAYGCDTRPDSVKTQSAIIFDILDSVFNNGLDGSEKTYEDALLKSSVMDLRKLRSEDLGYFYYWGKVSGKANRVFENFIIQTSRILEQNGYFVVVICGAAHVIKIIAEQEHKDIGSVLCIMPTDVKMALQGAKMFMALEQLANRQ
jgi:hypothetical protein